MDTELIAERTLILEGEAPEDNALVTVRIGRPYWTKPNVEAACLLEIDGIFGRVGGIFADDLLGALEAAICLADKMLVTVSHEKRLLFPSGEEYFSHFDILLKDRMK